jgi:uncharacterized protein YndB with AHSA1/START domain
VKHAAPALAFALVTLVGAAHGQQPLVTEGVVDAPLDSVWNAFTTAAGLESWMAAHASLDLRIGGMMQTVYAPVGTLGDASTIENTILAYEPKRMLAIKVSKAPAGFPFPNAIKRMWTVIYFEAVDSAKTRVREVGLGFGAEEESQKMRQFFDRGNAYTCRSGLRRRHVDVSPAGSGASGDSRSGSAGACPAA